jgi:hypothetical protein
MPASGSNKRLRSAIVALAVAAIAAVGAWLLLRAPVAPRTRAPTATSTRDTPADAGVVQLDRDTSRAKPTARLKPEASAPLPPRGAPLAQIYDELKARADAGDASAASRLYHDIRRCMIVLDRVPAMRGLVGNSQQGDDSDSGVNPDAMTPRQATVASVRYHLSKDAQAATRQCADLSPAQLQIMPAALRAAQLGDNAAADCYVGIPVSFARGLMDHPQWLLQYKENALALADAAIRRGDWTMVEQLQASYAQKGVNGELLHQLTGTDPAMAYRYSRLELLAMTEHPDIPGNSLDQQRAMALAWLSPAAIEAGDAWADEVHRRYFGADPDGAMRSEMGICEVENDEAPAR